MILLPKYLLFLESELLLDLMVREAMMRLMG